MKPPAESIHPELRRFASRLPQFSANKKSLRTIRLLERFVYLHRKPGDARIENLFIAGTEKGQQIRLRVYRPKSAASRAPGMLWLHGGGYVVGKPEQDDDFCAQLVRELGMVIVSVDYHTAPEFQFPVALSESYASLEWTVAHAGELGLDTKRIAIGGRSAGGGLAAALVQEAVDLKEIRIAFQLLIYPMLDDRTALREDLAVKGYLGWDLESNRFGWEAYLGTGCGAENLPEYAAPARRKNLCGLPPAWMGVGTLDLFYEEDVVYAQRLKECGVPCELVEVPGAFHGFDLVAPRVPLVRDFRASQFQALRRYLLRS